MINEKSKNELILVIDKIFERRQKEIAEIIVKDFNIEKRLEKQMQKAITNFNSTMIRQIDEVLKEKTIKMLKSEIRSNNFDILVKKIQTMKYTTEILNTMIENEILYIIKNKRYLKSLMKTSIKEIMIELDRKQIKIEKKGLKLNIKR